MNLLAENGSDTSLKSSLHPEKTALSLAIKLTAVPLRPWASGVRAFCADQSGNVFYDHNGSAD